MWNWFSEQGYEHDHKHTDIFGSLHQCVFSVMYDYYKKHNLHKKHNLEKD